ncbi:uncharacterized protein [Rutidosis leptorrhynchoides]|uniref:uncharacterized protein n=1 Tax=Rutidosis leptorrhynchoides TaxID=125765 RepID=UPI003A9A5BE0
MEITNSLIVHGGPYFPNLEELVLSLGDFEGGVEELVSGKLVCDSFSCVKSLTLTFVDFDSSDVLGFMYEIIWGFPNLQTLTIKALSSDSYDHEDPSLELCTLMEQLQLLNVVLENFEGLENELFFIKKLLACTPLLKKFTIRPDPTLLFPGGYEEKFKVAKKLLRFQRASAIADVDLDWS